LSISIVELRWQLVQEPDKVGYMMMMIVIIIINIS